MTESGSIVVCVVNGLLLNTDVVSASVVAAFNKFIVIRFCTKLFIIDHFYFN
jgi:hypothetical protein